MKLAVSSYSLSQWRRTHGKTVEQSIDKVAELGVKGVELSGLWDGGQPAEASLTKRAATLRRRAERRGLKVAGYSIGANFLCGKKAQRETIEQVKQHVDAAGELGVRTMRHDVAAGFDRAPGYRGPRTFAAALKTIVPAVREVADHAAKRGVIATLENHGFFMQAPDRVQKLIDAVDHEHFRLTIDLGNFLCVNADPVAAARRLAKYVVMAHAKDFHVKPKKDAPPDQGWIFTPTPIAIRGAIVGHGVIDVPAQLKILKRTGYRGWLSLEFEGLEEPIGAVEKGLANLKRYLAAR